MSSPYHWTTIKVHNKGKTGEKLFGYKQDMEIIILQTPPRICSYFEQSCSCLCTMENCWFPFISFKHVWKYFHYSVTKPRRRIMLLQMLQQHRGNNREKLWIPVGKRWHPRLWLTVKMQACFVPSIVSGEAGSWPGPHVTRHLVH